MYICTRIISARSKKQLSILLLRDGVVVYLFKFLSSSSTLVWGFGDSA